MAADQKDDQRIFQAKQRELLMAVKDLSKHAILADAGDLEDQLERGKIALPTSTTSTLYCLLSVILPLILLFLSSTTLTSDTYRTQEAEIHS